MEIEALLAIGMFVVAIAALMAGYPVALTLGGIALVFAAIGIALGVFPEPLLRAFASRIQGNMENSVLVAVPLFILMGVVLERSRVAEDLLQIASRLLARVRGGLGYAVVIVGALLAASTGIVGATVITMTLIALPTMLRQGYDVRLATGTIAASGTLGQIIPPSIVLILLADAISNANQSASLSGDFGPSAVSVGDLFAGALIPGALLVLIYLAYLVIVAIFRPETCPPLEASDEPAPTLQEIGLGLGAPLFLIIAVLGSIMAGLASPTEASAIGAGGAIILAGLRLAREAGSGLSPLLVAGLFGAAAIVGLSNIADLRITRTDIGTGDWLAIGFAGFGALVFLASLVAGLVVLEQTARLRPALSSASKITSMVFVILIGASLFSLVLRGYGGDEMIESVLRAVPGGKWGALAITMAVMFVLGFFLDFIEIVFVVVPLVAPPLILLGVDPVWLAILMALNLQTSFLTPPFGFALFYLRGSAPEGVETADIWWGALPFIGLQVLLIGIVAAVPSLSTWLPGIAAS